MRLIDEVALINEAESGGWDTDIKELRMILKYVPTIDAVAVVRGEWIQKHHIISLNNMTLTGTYPTCNLCDYAEVGMAKKSNYCPNCGAKMDGGDT